MPLFLSGAYWSGIEKFKVRCTLLRPDVYSTQNHYLFTMDPPNNHYSSQNDNFLVPSGGQNPNRAPGHDHWAPHQPHTATPAGSSRGFGFNDYDNIIYTSNTLQSDDPAFYGLAYFQSPTQQKHRNSSLSCFCVSATLRPILELDQVPGNPGPLFRLQKQTQKQRRNRIE